MEKGEGKKIPENDSNQRLPTTSLMHPWLTCKDENEGHC